MKNVKLNIAILAIAVSFSGNAFAETVPAQEKAAQEAERKRLDDIAAEQSKKEAELKAKQDAIDAEDRRIEDEKRKAEEDRLLKERIARERSDAAEKAKKDEAERIERENREKAETERLEREEQARIEALKPDKDKFNAYVNGIIIHMQKTCPAIKDKDIYKALVDVEATIENAIDTAIKTLEGLCQKKKGKKSS